MGRKRTSTKQDLTLWIETDLVKRMKDLELNGSAIFTKAAKEELEKYEEDGTLKENKEN